MAEPLERRAGRGIHGLLCALGAGYLALYVAVSLARMAHPYELDWFEGSSVDLVRRIFAGKPLYVAPSREGLWPVTGLPTRPQDLYLRR